MNALKLSRAVMRAAHKLQRLAENTLYKAAQYHCRVLDRSVEQAFAKVDALDADTEALQGLVAESKDRAQRQWRDAQLLAHAVALEKAELEL
jgi:Asp-tRNA(Asn)/Glu-tRNA(Gln) amidotransferase A subunit family amidase